MDKKSASPVDRTRKQEQIAKDVEAKTKTPRYIRGVAEPEVKKES